jgi:hypothetical protein
MSRDELAVWLRRLLLLVESDAPLVDALSHTTIELGLYPHTGRVRTVTRWNNGGD